jgi:hypothetical protein
MTDDFAFQFLPVTSLEDVTSNFQQLQAITNGEEPLKTKYGQAELAFEAAATAEVKVTHELGAAPKFIFVSQDHQIAGPVWPEYEVPTSEATLTEFRIFARNVESKVATAQVVLNWMAVG